MQILFLILSWGLTAKVLTLNADAAQQFFATELRLHQWHWCGAWDAFFVNLSELTARSIVAPNPSCDNVPLFLVQSSARLGNWIYRMSP